MKPFCTVPFAEGFSGLGAPFRNCCAADPQIQSLPGQTFAQWQQDARLVEFKQQLLTNTWPSACHRCEKQETQAGTSFRTAVNNSVEINENFQVWPSRWNLIFGNVCNLACWSCNETSSSVIMQHKKTIGILPVDFVDPNKTFLEQWKTLKQDVLKSYEYHNTVTLTLLGGEPMYNKTVSEFLAELIELGLAPRTRLEFHTNGTKVNQKLFSKDTWNYVCVFLSLDAVGPKAEWLRYGCCWADIESNIEFFKSVSNYTEVHCTLSVLNIMDLPVLKTFCESVDLPLKVMLLADPEFMCILNWSGDPALLVDRASLAQHGFEYYYDQIGTRPDPQSEQLLQDYIAQFDSIRKPLTKLNNKYIL
jgi:organic radical activating enzyme